MSGPRKNNGTGKDTDRKLPTNKPHIQKQIQEEKANPASNINNNASTSKTSTTKQVKTKLFGGLASYNSVVSALPTRKLADLQNKQAETQNTTNQEAQNTTNNPLPPTRPRANKNRLEQVNPELQQKIAEGEKKGEEKQKEEYQSFRPGGRSSSD